MEAGIVAVLALQPFGLCGCVMPHANFVSDRLYALMGYPGASRASLIRGSSDPPAYARRKRRAVRLLKPSTLLTIPEVMYDLRVSRAPIYNMVGRKDLTIVKVGSATRISRASLDRYIDSYTLEATKHAA